MLEDSLIGLQLVLLVVALLAVVTALLYWLWNTTMPDVFGLKSELLPIVKTTFWVI